MRKSIAPLSCAIFALTCSVNISGATFVQTELLPADLAVNSHFGRSVAAAGNILAAGAFTTLAPGAVYVFQRNSDNWTQQAELHAPNPSAQDEFGLSVATDGNTLVAGGRAATYIFTNNNGVWTNQAAVAFGGFSVAVSRDTAAIASGAQVEIVRRNGAGQWAIEAVLAPGQSATAIALDGNTLVIGAATASAPAGNAVGTAFVYVRNGTAWAQQATLNANDPSAFSNFGFGVTISGDSVVIGAPGDGTDVLNELPGSAYVFVRNNGVWTEQAEFTGPSEGSNYGTGLSLIGNTLVVGAYDDDSDNDDGSAFVYTRNGSNWIQTATLVPQDGVTGQRFANTVAMADANTFVFGSPNTAKVAINGGSVYVCMQH